VSYVYFIDLGAVHDPTVIGIGHADEQVVYIDKLITLQGFREQPVQISVVEAKIKEPTARFAPKCIRIESWQGLSVAQSLTSLGYPVELFTPTTKAHANEWPVLAQRLTARTLVLPPACAVREELLNLT
jgi:hypothetical protein